MIGTYRVSGGRIYVPGEIIRELPDDTKVEIAALRPAEPERRVVMPVGAEWVRYPASLKDCNWFLVKNNKPLADLWSGRPDGWHWRINSMGDSGLSERAEGFEATQLAVAEALADIGEDGWGWENVGPEYWFYTVLCDETDHRSPPSPTKWRPLRHRASAQDRFDEAVAAGNWKDVRLLGFNVSSTGDLQMDELDRFEAEH